MGIKILYDDSMGSLFAGSGNVIANVYSEQARENRCCCLS